ncbi:MAG: cache domain-containing protein [Deltaproteobacteria bacterium]|jgi:PAS domain S-box-containing protein|nr:cache domain-containing protein [Deltaproteobacteria bacterium]
MRLRILIFVLALLAFLSATTGGWLYYHSFKKAALQKAETNTKSRLELIQRQLSTYLAEHIKSVKALANIKECRIALTKPDIDSIKNINNILDNFNNALDVEVTYILDIQGNTIASSNRNAPDSFMGNNFSFRPYYKKAIRGTGTTYLALGATSKKRGVYYSYPIFDRTKILGVAVIKASVEFVESSLFSRSQGILLFTDPNGIIFISNKEELRFMLLWDIKEEKITQIRESRQFGDGPWTWTGFSMKKPGTVISRLKEHYFHSSIRLENYPGWEIIHLRNYKDIKKIIADPFIKIIGPIVVIVSILIGIAALILYNKAAQEIVRRKNAENELRLSGERYRNIYHKTPVMLHSINTEGRIIRVSDHWLEKMGYEREEVIGEKLTSFYTEDSRRYAEDIIFPEFFTTGFCEDIPYTYVTKNYGKIEILLSCYGVRNELGEIERSLAVSVDVTEKNRTQMALQETKAKLSQYSMDLEKQVAKRTEELQKTKDNLKRLSENIMISQEREKAIVAGELHDHLGQVLTALRIDTVWIKKLLSQSNKDAESRAEKMCSLIDNTIDDVREMAYRLRPRVLDDLGLVDALESMISDFEKRSNVSCVFKHKKIGQINETLTTALYRITQEAVTNALRHSSASSIEVELKMDGSLLILNIKDNGCGFIKTDENEINTFGLAGMEERADLAGGKLEIFSTPENGTEICCKIKMEV